MHYGAGSAPLGTIGLVKPTYRPGSLEETIRLLPEGVGVVPMHAGVRTGDTQEFRDVLAVVADRVAELAALGVSAVYVEGAPPGMLLGYGEDARLAASLSERHGLPVSFASTAAVDALADAGARAASSGCRTPPPRRTRRSPATSATPGSTSPSSPRSRRPSPRRTASRRRRSCAAARSSAPSTPTRMPCTCSAERGGCSPSSSRSNGSAAYRSAPASRQASGKSSASSASATPS